jgi:hypothetical protein
MPNSPGVDSPATVLPDTVPYTVLGTYTHTGCAARGNRRASVSVAPLRPPSASGSPKKISELTGNRAFFRLGSLTPQFGPIC